MDAYVTLLLVLLALVLAVSVAVGMLWLMNRLLVGRPMTTEQLAEQERQIRERLLQPKWDELCAHFGQSMPQSLRDLYSNRGLVIRTNFFVQPPGSHDESADHFIARFEPADSQAVVDTWFPIGEARFPFATDDFG